ncbi:class I SAM-dependent methyltransferase, partial [uncultured Variovorax sp.]|uniref:class I SAM-dependent methyltransferase n=1 Tax=uncultured Variovorax sp. TaxID=114708 RepID=UPI0025CFE378
MSLPTPSAPVAEPALDAAPSFSPLRRLLARTRFGRLALTLPGGRSIEVAGSEPGPHASLRLSSWRPIMRLLMQGDLGLALSFRDGEWESPDLLALFEFGLANEAAWGSLLKGRGPARWLARLLHMARRNSRSGSRHNISFHYDLGNEFYRHWLDDSMLYSSAIFSDEPDDTLEAAQARRLDAILRMLDTPQGANVLEIGCGWGTLAASLARRHDARVTGLTLSSEQLAFARERGQEWG